MSQLEAFFLQENEIYIIYNRNILNKNTFLNFNNRYTKPLFRSEIDGRWIVRIWKMMGGELSGSEKWWEVNCPDLKNDGRWIVRIWKMMGGELSEYEKCLEGHCLGLGLKKCLEGNCPGLKIPSHLFSYPDISILPIFHHTGPCASYGGMLAWIFHHTGPCAGYGGKLAWIEPDFLRDYPAVIYH